MLNCDKIFIILHRKAKFSTVIRILLEGSFREPRIALACIVLRTRHACKWRHIRLPTNNISGV